MRADDEREERWGERTHTAFPRLLGTASSASTNEDARPFVDSSPKKCTERARKPSRIALRCLGVTARRRRDDGDDASDDDDDDDDGKVVVDDRGNRAVGTNGTGDDDAAARNGGEPPPG